MLERAGLWAVGGVMICVSGLAQAQEAPPAFFKGKTLDMIVSSGVGGGQDANARLIARHWARHIPGAATMVVKNMPGAGHLRAANFLANQAPKDGTVLSALVPSFVLSQVLQTSKGIQFDAAQFGWLGASAANNSTFYVWSTSPVQTMADAARYETPMGATGAGSYTMIYPAIMNAIVGTKFKIVAGYKSTAEVNLALERGEVQGRAGNNFNSLKMENGDWLRDGKIRLLAQVGLDRDPEYPDLPLMMEFGKTAEDRSLLQLFSADIALGRPFLTTPGVPADRLELLRSSFMATMKDAALLKEAHAANLEISPVPGARLQEIVREIVSTPPDVARRAREALAGFEGGSAQ
ncbi:MAG: tripartite tricarboxylate transporter substrate-binding protein [Beijerinckiaceae bacterium]|nr:tripartite tricarboxylate transporter substrate-binding protein [Beijerinckiaceae bacterium]